MKILFSPSESKTTLCTNKPFDENSFIFPELYKERLKILKHYDKFLQNSNLEQISKIFGIKNLKDSKLLRTNIFEKETIKAILRYDGIAYKHLDYRSLDDLSRDFIDNNVLIFSNLFGCISAKDLLPEYKLKQGEKLPGLNIENFYKNNFSNKIDELLKNDDVVDLRAEFYEKFYDIKKPFTTFKFLKNGKVVSHYAKAYRGFILRQIAKNNIKNTKDLGRMQIENLKLTDIKQIGLKSEILLEIH